MANIALCRVPFGLPAGLPDWPAKTVGRAAYSAADQRRSSLPPIVLGMAPPRNGRPRLLDHVSGLASKRQAPKAAPPRLVCRGPEVPVQLRPGLCERDDSREGKTDYLLVSTSSRRRPQLRSIPIGICCAAARRTGSVLLVAKLDRLSRDVHFLTDLEKAGVEFVACDMPVANRLTVHIMATVAQAKRKMLETDEGGPGSRQGARRQAWRTEWHRPDPCGWQRHSGSIGDREVRRQPASSGSRLDHRGDTGRRRVVSAEGRDELNCQRIKTARGGRWHAATVSRLETRVG
jgi:hypothetical protein